MALFPSGSHLHPCHESVSRNFNQVRTCMRTTASVYVYCVLPAPVCHLLLALHDCVRADC